MCLRGPGLSWNGVCGSSGRVTSPRLPSAVPEEGLKTARRLVFSRLRAGEGSPRSSLRPLASARPRALLSDRDLRSDVATR